MPNCGAMRSPSLSRSHFLRFWRCCSNVASSLLSGWTSSFFCCISCSSISILTHLLVDERHFSIHCTHVVTLFAKDRVSTVVYTSGYTHISLTSAPTLYGALRPTSTCCVVNTTLHKHILTTCHIHVPIVTSLLQTYTQTLSTQTHFVFNVEHSHIQTHQQICIQSLTH